MPLELEPPAAGSSPQPRRPCPRGQRSRAPIEPETMTPCPLSTCGMKGQRHRKLPRGPQRYLSHCTLRPPSSCHHLAQLLRYLLYVSASAGRTPMSRARCQTYPPCLADPAPDSDLQTHRACLAAGYQSEGMAQRPLPRGTAEGLAGGGSSRRLREGQGFCHLKSADIARGRRPDPPTGWAFGWAAARRGQASKMPLLQLVSTAAPQNVPAASL
mmetsp:Transcript_18484/g.29616  ORF Transcript_18484/g.29616 Transcript_18484/m.29616 type:complete len:214 (+) Transcript_18484:77-718(+)